MFPQLTTILTVSLPVSERFGTLFKYLSVQNWQFHVDLTQISWCKYMKSSQCVEMFNKWAFQPQNLLKEAWFLPSVKYDKNWCTKFSIPYRPNYMKWLYVALYSMVQFPIYKNIQLIFLCLYFHVWGQKWGKILKFEGTKFIFRKVSSEKQGIYQLAHKHFPLHSTYKEILH